MPDAVTSQTLFNGSRRLVVKLTNTSDGTGESGAVKVDVSAIPADARFGSVSEVKVNKITYDITGMTVSLLWDATTDVVFATLSGNGCIDMTDKGGIKNNSGDGKTGDILLTTTGHTSGDTYTIILEMVKIY
jgi:hypothetical protein